MNKLIEQVSKIRRTLSYTPGKISIEELLKLSSREYLPLYYDNNRKALLIQSRVIERIFANLELPPLYKTGKVLDIIGYGNDLYTKPVLRFLSDKLKLEGLSVLTELEGLTYSELPPELQEMFLSYKLDTIEFSDVDVESDDIFWYTLALG